MEFPLELRLKIGELTEKEDVKALARAAEELSKNYRNEQTDGKRAAGSKRDILAYSAVRMPATFAAVSRALELSLRQFDGEIGSVLDVGAGTGAGAIAASLLTECREIVCVEREKNMIELGTLFFECLGMSADWVCRDVSRGITEKADLVICSYCLNELPESRRSAVVSELAAAANKLLVIVEPGTPKAFAQLKQTRARLMQCGLKIAAPCPCEDECPLPEDDWCHFSARAARSKLHKQLKGADVPYEDEKFCFVAAAKENARPCAGRIIRKPYIEPKKITLSVCSGKGVSTEIVTKKSPLYKAARKAAVGDIFPTESIDE